MNKAALANACKTARKVLVKHAPEIITTVGTVSMLVGGVLAVKATPKALKLIEEKKKEEHKDELKTTEVVKTTWKCYAPAVGLAVAGAACVLGGNHVHLKRNAALTAAYKISETAYSEYKKKVTETLGEKKEQIIRDKVAQEKVEKTPVNTNSVIITGNGHTLCMDTVFGQYFESDIESIKKAVNEINYQMLSQEYMSLNQFYDELGIPRIDIGDQVGWNISKQGKLEVEFNSTIATNGQPCITITYLVNPQYEYDRWH